MTLFEKAANLFKELQEQISSAIEESDTEAKFISDSWQRLDIDGSDGGGGESRIIKNGKVFEKAGVNFSLVHGSLTEDFAEKLVGKREKLSFKATGISLVIHPLSPLVPTTHANWRYLEVAGQSWFGGGSDLTPYYLFEDDAHHFHRVLRETCELHDPNYYKRFKEWCDKYFYLPHRQEARGVGGLFFDYLGKDGEAESYFNFVADLGRAFTRQYIPIVERRKNLSFTPRQRDFQLMRRGRYVEFNLLYDRGTHFGLQTNGRTESILMSLPPLVSWEYNYQEQPGTPEAELLSVVRSPKNWGTGE